MCSIVLTKQVGTDNNFKKPSKIEIENKNFLFWVNRTHVVNKIM